MRRGIFRKHFHIQVAFLIIVIFMASPVDCKAVDIYSTQAEVLETDELTRSLPPDARSILKEYSIQKGVSFERGVNSILDKGSRQAGGILKSAARSAVSVLLIILCCGIAQSLYEAGSSAVPNYVTMVGALALSLTVSSELTSFIGLGKSLIEGLDTFSKALLATLAAASSALGQPASAAAKYMATALFMDILITVVNRLIMPVLYTYIATVTANAALGDNMLGKLSSFLKWSCITTLGLIVTAFSTYLAVTGIIAGTTDAATLKATKMILSNAIPVVGKMLADASDTILASTRVLRNSLGVFGMIGVFAICVTPFLRLGIHYLLFKLIAIASSSFCEKRLSDLIDSLAGAFGIIMGMLGACAIINIISIVSVISVVGQ